MGYEVDFDIGRVVFVNAQKYTVDLVSINGNQYKEIPFLNLYSKPASNGQGIYMMPERDSYAVILKLGHNFGDSSKFAIGFFNNLDQEGGYSHGREDINQGDFVAKTVFGNKVIGRTDGSITVMASDQSQMTLFPESGNKEDSWGFDNLFRALFENFELNTDAGHIHQHVNKKDKTTNVQFEVRNKPLYSENPQVIRGNIGNQGPFGDPSFFTTLEVVDKIADGEEEVLRQELKIKTNGEKTHKVYDDSETLIRELTISADYDRIIKTYLNGSLKYHEETLSDGTSKRIIYEDDSEVSKKIEEIKNSDGSYLKKVWDNNNNLILEETHDNLGSASINLGSNQEISISLDGTTGNLDLSIKGDKNITVEGDANFDVGGDASVSATNINLDGTSNIGGRNGKAIARVGDSVQVAVTGGSSAGTYTGTIQSGASNSFAE